MTGLGSSIPGKDAMTDGGVDGGSEFWLDYLNKLGADAINFLARRIEEDVKTQSDLLRCNDPAEFHQIRERFIRSAIEQYQAETGTLIDFSKLPIGGGGNGDK